MQNTHAIAAVVAAICIFPFFFPPGSADPPPPEDPVVVQLGISCPGCNEVQFTLADTITPPVVWLMECRLINLINFTFIAVDEAACPLNAEVRSSAALNENPAPISATPQFDAGAVLALQGTCRFDVTVLVNNNGVDGPVFLPCIIPEELDGSQIP